MRDDQEQRLIELSESTTEDLINIVQAANEVGFESPEQRGEKVWLYKGANQCASTIANIERVLAMKRGDLPPASKTQETQEKYEAQILAKAEAQAAKLRKQYS